MDEEEAHHREIMEVIKRNPRLDNLITHYLRFSGLEPARHIMPNEADREH